MKTGKRMISLILSLLLVLAMTFVGGMTLPICAIDGSAEGQATVKVTNSEMHVTVGYKQSRSFEFEASGVPDGAAVYVFFNGEKLRADLQVTVSEPTEDYTVEARILDANDETIASSGEIEVTVKNGFLDRIAAFLKNTLGTAADAVADVFGAIFMKILVLLNGGRFLK